MQSFPVDSVLPRLRDVFSKSGRAVLTASPGAGKTTRIPLALLRESWLADKKILLLEPRRLAARAAAQYMAFLLDEDVGQTVGYRMRLDTKVSNLTRIEVVTEGVLTRLLLADPALEDVGLVIFDEFHERSLQADLGLALCLESQEILRPDLRILVMSATLDTEPVAALLDNAPVLKAAGRSYPVETRYLAGRSQADTETLVTQTVLKVLAGQEGDILVFLPGAAEIRRVMEKLGQSSLPEQVRVLPLYGNLSRERQDMAILPGRPGERKVVLATSIAETSLTVEGVRNVIDSGLMRVPRFSPRTGMTRLETISVSQSSADQRRGRAGRLGPGLCYRLWTREENARLEFSTVPEILESDLTMLVLDLAVWGSEPEKLRWLDKPPDTALQSARRLLVQLEAFDQNGHVTPHGRQMAALGLHPRLAHMILKAKSLGLGNLACEIAALLGERDLFRVNGTKEEADLRLRVDVLRAEQGEYPADKSVRQRVRLTAGKLMTLAKMSKDNNDDPDACGLLLAMAYPDRIGQCRDGSHYLLSNGRGAVLFGRQALSGTPYLVAAEVGDQGAEGTVFLAAPVAVETVRRYLSGQFEERDRVEWERDVQAVRGRKQICLGALVIKEIPLADPAPEKIRTALLAGIALEGIHILPWTRVARHLQQRILFMRWQDPDWPDVSDEALTAALPFWLGPYLEGMNSREDLAQLRLSEILLTMLTWEQRRDLEEFAPTHLVVPSGQRIPIDYSRPEAPFLAVRLQEMFGLQTTPCIGRRNIPLTLQLLSPAQRPVQITRDLASFWQTAYFAVRKDLLGRYPKHYWPEDPLSAQPTSRVRPQKRGSGEK
ncbi:dead/deah box helicase [Lucifera butyrica]|uniref:Dead/deah box helicase n=1 Tax=Lucifera butyrica TaxID=1351585 RepID=A0A498R2V6_9FIRM|nr:ATP-dependent helicase HrpB [Lucifera butyrica]VBB06966.1 dead/deah box helicase [Lucifera butyrica]